MNREQFINANSHQAIYNIFDVVYAYLVAKYGTGIHGFKDVPYPSEGSVNRKLTFTSDGMVIISLLTSNANYETDPMCQFFIGAFGDKEFNLEPRSATDIKALLFDDLRVDYEFMEDVKKSLRFLEEIESFQYFEDLLDNFGWHKILKRSETGEDVSIPRKMGYVSDVPTIYKYAGLELPGTIWNESLLKIKAALLKETGINFNSVLLNLYENGKDEIKWHSDKEEQLGDRPVIACVNLGASRTMHFGRIGRKDQKRSLMLRDGDLLIMREECQRRWVHAIPKEKSVKEPRISLTFRVVK